MVPASSSSCDRQLEAVELLKVCVGRLFLLHFVELCMHGVPAAAPTVDGETDKKQAKQHGKIELKSSNSNYNKIQ